VTVFVRSRKIPSVYVPKAVNGLERDTEKQLILAAAGVTSIDTSSAGFIVNKAPVEVFPEEVAVIMVVPTDLDVAKPCEPVALLITATAGFDDCHVTAAVISCVGTPRCQCGDIQHSPVRIP
jgi:hypothetical protein